MSSRNENSVLWFDVAVCVDAREKWAKRPNKRKSYLWIIKLLCTYQKLVYQIEKVIRDGHFENVFSTSIKRERFPKRLSPSACVLMIFLHKEKAWMKVNFDLCVTFFCPKCLIYLVYIHLSYFFVREYTHKIHQWCSAFFMW